MRIRVAARLAPDNSDGYFFTTLTESEWEWAKLSNKYYVVGEVECDLAKTLNALSVNVDEMVKAMEDAATANYAAAISKIADFKAKMLCLEAPK